MNPQETVMLAAYVKACCPQQALGEYTPDAWHDLLGDLNLDDCRTAVAAVAKRQPFVAPSEIRAEVKRIRERRLAVTPPPAPPHELADRPGAYRKALRDGIQRLADGFDVAPAIEGAPRDGEPPEEYQAARKALPEAPPAEPDYAALAREQAAESRKEREREGWAG